MKTVSVSLVGVGGQGIILTSDLLARAAAIAGYDVKKSEIHGMAQRGGSVTSQVRFGKSVFSPIIPHGTADILVSFDKLEALRSASVLSSEGTALVNDMYLVPVTVSSGQQQPVKDLDGRVAKAFKKLVIFNAQKIASEEVGNDRTMNMVIAGALSTLCPFPENVWLDAMKELLSGPKAKLLEVNRKAFSIGRERAKAS